LAVVSNVYTADAAPVALTVMVLTAGGPAGFPAMSNVTVYVEPGIVVSVWLIAPALLLLPVRSMLREPLEAAQYPPM
jgi:hypothetical protein